MKSFGMSWYMVVGIVVRICQKNMVDNVEFYECQNLFLKIFIFVEGNEMC